MHICNDVMYVICCKVDNLLDLNNLRLVCKGFNKQVQLYKKELTTYDCIMISYLWCPHSRMCISDWNQLKIAFNNKIKGKRIIKVKLVNHDGSGNEIYGIRIVEYPTFLMNGKKLGNHVRGYKAWSDIIMNDITNDIR